MDASKAVIQSALLDVAFRCVPSDIARSKARSCAFAWHSGDCGSIACYAAVHIKILYNWPAFCLRCVSAHDTTSFLPFRSHHTAQNYTVHRAALSAIRLHGVLAGICEGGSTRELTQFFVISHSAMLLRYVHACAVGSTAGLPVKAFVSAYGEIICDLRPKCNN